jgi:hypothetical protein
MDAVMWFTLVSCSATNRRGKATFKLNLQLFDLGLGVTCCMASKGKIVKVD